MDDEDEEEEEEEGEEEEGEEDVSDGGEELNSRVRAMEDYSHMSEEY